MSFKSLRGMDTQPKNSNGVAMLLRIGRFIRIHLTARTLSLMLCTLLAGCIILHGGPGGAERPLFRYFNIELENHFVVVYWDQRGAGRSFDPKVDLHRLSIAQSCRRSRRRCRSS
jgi:hypothetical protein